MPTDPKNSDSPSKKAAAPEEIVLFNAMREEDIFVLEGGKRKKLSRAPKPTLLQMPSSKGASSLTVRRKPSGPGIDLEFYAAEEALGILSVPPENPSVMYLVEPEVILEFPHRTDFVTPAAWELDRGKKKIDLSRMNLVSVTRTPYAVVTADTPIYCEGEQEPAPQPRRPRKGRSAGY